MYEPILYNEDHVLWQKEPLQSSFESITGYLLRSKEEKMLQEAISKISKDPAWVSTKLYHTYTCTY
jgi:hypothetical protein